MGGRIDIKPDNVAQLVDEPRVVGKLELMDPARLETMRAPEPGRYSSFSDRFQKYEKMRSAPAAGRHHVGTPGDIISECPGDFVGIRKPSDEPFQGGIPASLASAASVRLVGIAAPDHMIIELGR